MNIMEAAQKAMSSSKCITNPTLRGLKIFLQPITENSGFTVVARKTNSEFCKLHPNKWIPDVTDILRTDWDVSGEPIRTAEIKFELVKAMNTIIRNLYDEIPYQNDWKRIVPYYPEEEDIQDVAADEEKFADAVYIFKKIMEEHLRYGIYVGGEKY